MADRINRDDMNRDERDTLARDPNASRLARLDDLDDYEVADGEPDVRGWTVKSADGRELGEVESLIVDPAAMEVRYLETKVKHEALGTKDDRNVLIPIGAARLDEKDDVVFIDRLPASGLRGAPAYTRAPITPAYERSLRDFYGPALASGGREARDEDFYNHRRFFGGRRPERENARYITLSEERLAVSKRPVQRGEVEVRKTVDTEHVRRQVPTMHEEVRVERRPAPPGAPASPSVGPDEIRVPVMGEEVVVEKRAVPKEEVVIRKETVRDSKTVEADLKKERVDVERKGDAERRP